MFYQLTENCEYDELNSKMIHNRLVVGIWDNSISQQLQIKAKTRICQKEAVHHQQGILKGNTDTHVASDVEEIKQTKAKHPMTAHLALQRSVCVKPKHPCDKCPGQDAECFKCHKKGHYSGLCLSKRPIISVSIVQTTTPAEISDNDSDENFLGTVESQQETQWIKLLKVNDVEVRSCSN